MPSVDRMTSPVFLLVLISAISHAAYSRLLVAAYEHGEISLVYPIARVSGIALTAILASLFFKESFALLGSIGIALICAGIIQMVEFTIKVPPKLVPFQKKV